MMQINYTACCRGTMLVLLCLVVGFAQAQQVALQSNAAQPSLDDLVRNMTGSFSSTAQAKVDTSYYDITMHMYPIWTDGDAKWMYIEQAVTSNPDKPYRQRVYKVEQTGDMTFVSRVFELEDPTAAVGKWREPEWFNQFTPDQLLEKEGCEVFLTWNRGVYGGETNIKTCASSLYGASYATSQVKVFPEKVVSWDRGFNDLDEQVWGQTKSGYEFRKM